MPSFRAYGRVASSLSLLLAATAANAESVHDPVLGYWLTEEQGVVVEFYECDDEALCGRIAWLKYPYDEDTGRLKRDALNPEPALRDRPWCGITVLDSIDHRKNVKWGDGVVYNPEDGNNYGFKMKLLDDRLLRVRAFVAIGLLGRSETWTRLEADGNWMCPQAEDVPTLAQDPAAESADPDAQGDRF
ncbi:MAG: DUF2147 domain-containing protein [Maricaulaceae bacterium]